jgi:hypothetical protein
MKYAPCPRYIMKSARNAAMEQRPFDAGDVGAEAMEASEPPIGDIGDGLIPIPVGSRLLFTNEEFLALCAICASLRLCTPTLFIGPRCDCCCDELSSECEESVRNIG